MKWLTGVALPAVLRIGRRAVLPIGGVLVAAAADEGLLDGAVAQALLGLFVS